MIGKISILLDDYRQMKKDWAGKNPCSLHVETQMLAEMGLAYYKLGNVYKKQAHVWLTVVDEKKLVMARLKYNI